MIASRETIDALAIHGGYSLWRQRDKYGRWAITCLDLDDPRLFWPVLLCRHYNMQWSMTYLASLRYFLWTCAIEPPAELQRWRGRVPDDVTCSPMMVDGLWCRLVNASNHRCNLHAPVDVVANIIAACIEHGLQMSMVLSDEDEPLAIQAQSHDLEQYCTQTQPDNDPLFGYLERFYHVQTKATRHCQRATA